MDENVVEQTIDVTGTENAKKEAVIQTESVRVQKAEWIKQETERRRKLEDDMLEQLMTEQRMIDELNRSIDVNMKLTRESKRYNEEVRENLHAQVYAMHGISEDKLSGMKEYKNAYYKGVAFGMFFLSVVMVVLCGIFHGVTTQITLFMAFFTGIEGALLTRERDRGKVLDGLCKLLYMLLFPSMLGIFACYELGLSQYGLLLPYFCVAGAVILVLGTVSFFAYTPYREDRRKAGEAKNTLRDLEKQAGKEVKRNQKLRKKEEKKEVKAAVKEKERQNREAEKAEEIRKREEEKAARKAKNAILRLEKTEAFKESAGEKWEDFKARFHKKDAEVIEAAAAREGDAEVIDSEMYEEAAVVEATDVSEMESNTEIEA